MIKFEGGVADGAVERLQSDDSGITVAVAGRGADSYVPKRDADGHVAREGDALVYVPSA